MQKYNATLENLPLFEHMRLQDIHTVLRCMDAKTERYSKNEFIRMEGDPADFIGIVLDGMIQIQQHDSDGNRSITSSLHKGQIFGEVFVCAEIPTLPRDIFAATAVTVMMLNKRSLLQPCKSICEIHPQIIQNLMKVVARKSLLLSQKLSYVSRKTTGEKIMAYLRDQAHLHNSNEFTIPFNRQELADYLCVERSAMSAEISRLQKNGILETRRSHFRLLR